jgi:organic radical activating enzyme
MTSLIVSRMPGGEPEIFASVQGEGASAGIPSTFLRLAVCNLRCSWCDTAYTWDWERFERAEQTMELGAAEAVWRVTALAPQNVVITGGEPLIQRRQLVSVVEELLRAGLRVEVETNGTISPGELAPLVSQWNVSPKLASSGNERLKTLREDVLREFASLETSWFKFVVSSAGDVDEAAAIAAGAGMPSARVILMPEGRTPAELTERGRWLAEECTARGFRFSTRLHIYLWGDARGV